MNETDNRFLQYHFSGAEAMQQLNKIPVELVAQRVVELNTAFLELQKLAKITKQKHVATLEVYRDKSDQATPEEIKELRKKEKTKQKAADDWNALEAMMKQMGGQK